MPDAMLIKIISTIVQIACLTIAITTGIFIYKKKKNKK